MIFCAGPRKITPISRITLVITGDVISEEVVTEAASAEEVMAIETIPNGVISSDDVISSDVTVNQMEAVKMECDDALDQPSTSNSLRHRKEGAISTPLK